MTFYTTKNFYLILYIYIHVYIYIYIYIYIGNKINNKFIYIIID